MYYESCNKRIKAYNLYNCNISKPVDLSYLTKIAIRAICYAKSYFQEEIVLPKNYICRFLLQVKLILIIFNWVLFFRKPQERRLLLLLLLSYAQEHNYPDTDFHSTCKIYSFGCMVSPVVSSPNLSRIQDCQILVQVTSGYICSTEISNWLYN